MSRKQKLIDYKEKFIKPNRLIQIKIKSDAELNTVDQKMLNYFLKKKYDEFTKGNMENKYSVFLKFSEIKKNVFKKSKNIKALKASIRKIQEVQIEYNNKAGKTSWGIFSPISYAKRETLNNVVFYKIVFPEDIINAMLNADRKETYTYLNISQVLNFKSKYSIILYDIVKRYENMPKMNMKKFSREEFFDVFQIKSDSYKKYFYNVKKRIIEPAIEEINQKTLFKIKVEYIKQHRKITHIKFDYLQKPKTSKELEERVEKEKQQLSKDMKKGKQKAGIGFKITKNIDDVGKNQADNITYKKDFFSKDKED